MSPSGEELYITCRIKPGLFKSERFVEFEVKGTTYQTIADEEDVISLGSQPDGWETGLLRVYLMKENGSTVLVNLPRETSAGRRLSVPRDLLKTA